MWLLVAKSIISDYTHRTREVMYTLRDEGTDGFLSEREMKYIVIDGQKKGLEWEDQVGVRGKRRRSGDIEGNN